MLLGHTITLLFFLIPGGGRLSLGSDRHGWRGTLIIQELLSPVVYQYRMGIRLGYQTRVSDLHLNDIANELASEVTRE